MTVSLVVFRCPVAAILIKTVTLFSYSIPFLSVMQSFQIFVSSCDQFLFSSISARWFLYAPNFCPSPVAEDHASFSHASFLLFSLLRSLLDCVIGKQLRRSINNSPQISGVSRYWVVSIRQNKLPGRKTTWTLKKQCKIRKICQRNLKLQKFNKNLIKKNGPWPYNVP